MRFLDSAKKKMQKATSGMGEETVRVMDYDAPPVESQPSLDLTPSYEDSAFQVDDDANEYFVKQEQAHQELLDSYGDKPVPTVKEGRIEDVLQLLQIPATFEIEDRVLLPEDFKGIAFSVQVPQGYEMGEVNSFLAQAKYSVQELVKLLKLRNKHIAELATTVDRLQIDSANLKFQAEMANGINIMPTDDNEDVESENAELLIENRQLRERLAAVMKGGADDQLTSKERQVYEGLSDSLSIAQRELHTVKEENYALKSQLAVYQDEDSALNEANSNVTTYSGPVFSDYQTNGSVDDSEMPSFDVSEVVINPHAGSIPGISEGSAFSSDDEGSLDSFLEENKEFYEGHDYSSGGSAVEYDEDDDELDEIYNSMRTI